MARGKFLRNLLDEYHAAKAPQKGFFSTLDELIQQAPFEQAPADQWIGYLKPGRMLDRDGAQFPLKAEELEWSEILDTLKLRGEGEPGLAISKSDLLESVRRTRPSFALTVGDDELMRRFPRAPRSPRGVEPSANTPMQQTARSELEALADLQQPVGIRRLKIRGAHYGPNDYDDFDLENAQRLSHVSPGSRYQESVTRMQGYNYPQHFDRDALAWSRTSSHQSPSGRVRLVEEIQSDPHQQAAKRVKRSIDNLSPEEKSQLIQLQNEYGGSSQEVSDFWDSLTPGPRRGYITDDRRLREIVREYGRDPNAPIESAQLRADTPLDILNEFESDNRVPDAPFKDPADYGRLELRKQLINAANAKEDYLALTRGDDQIARYSLEGKEAENMRRVYDGTYRRELEKLARVYGAEIEDVEVPVRSVVDFRPQSMIDLDAETADDVVYEIFHGDQSGKDSVRNVIDDLAGHNATTRDSLHTLVDELEELVDAGAPESSRANKLNELITDKLEFLLGERARVMARAATADEVKTFPAIRLTPEVRERIKRIGVPLWSLVGGVPVLDELTSEGEDEEDEEVDPVQMSRGGSLKRALQKLRDRSSRVLDMASDEDLDVVQDWVKTGNLSPYETARLNRLISQVEIPEGITLFRGDPHYFVASRSRFGNPISTSTDKEVAKSFAEGILDDAPGRLSVITPEPGAVGLYTSPDSFWGDEHEVILPSTSRFHPTSARRPPPSETDEGLDIEGLQEEISELYDILEELDENYDPTKNTRAHDASVREELERLLEEKRKLVSPVERDYLLLRQRRAEGGHVDAQELSRGGVIKEALRKLRDRSNRVLDKASSEEHEVVDRWMSEHSDLSPSELETMDRLISRVSTPPGIVVHRGDARRLPIDMPAGEIKEHLENVPVVHDIVTRSQIDMPISTSTDPGIARSFARFLSYPGHVSHVTIPEGANALYLDSINVPEVPYEKEVVLPRRMHFEPTSDLRVPPRDNLPEILERIRELRYKQFTADGLTRPEYLELQRLVAERERLTLPTERDYIMLRRKALGGPVQMARGGSIKRTLDRLLHQTDRSYLDSIRERGLIAAPDEILEPDDKPGVNLVRGTMDKLLFPFPTAGMDVVVEVDASKLDPKKLRVIDDEWVRYMGDIPPEALIEAWGPNTAPLWRKRKFADGGYIDDARRRERAQQATHVEPEEVRDHRLLDRMLANLRMQVSSVNEEGDVVPFYRQETPEDFVMEFDASGYPTNLHERPAPEVRMPGVLLDATSLPVMFGLAGEDSVSGEALRKMEIIEQAMREQYDIDEPQGALEHGAEALGMMLGQIPVAPLGVAKGVAGALGRYVPKILRGRAARAATLPLRAGAEFMAPVVEPRASNYALGTAFGAATGIGSGGEEPPTEEPLYELGEYLVTGEQLVRLAQLMEAYHGSLQQRRDEEERMRHIPPFTGEFDAE